MRILLLVLAFGCAGAALETPPDAGEMPTPQPQLECNHGCMSVGIHQGIDGGLSVGATAKAYGRTSFELNDSPPFIPEWDCFFCDPFSYVLETTSLSGLT